MYATWNLKRPMIDFFCVTSVHTGTSERSDENEMECQQILSNVKGMRHIEILHWALTVPKALTSFRFQSVCQHSKISGGFAWAKDRGWSLKAVGIFEWQSKRPPVFAIQATWTRWKTSLKNNTFNQKKVAIPI